MSRWYHFPVFPVKCRVFTENIGREWKRIFGEEYAPAYMKEIKGYRFFCLNYLDHNGPASVKAVKELYAGVTAMPTDRPIFHIQHCHPSGTCGWWTGRNEDELTKFLSQYPNLIAISGTTAVSTRPGRSGSIPIDSVRAACL